MRAIAALANRQERLAQSTLADHASNRGSVTLDVVLIFNSTNFIAAKCRCQSGDPFITQTASIFVLDTFAARNMFL